jgi:hypothetical protein
MARLADVKASQRKGLRAVWAGIGGMYLFVFGIGGCQHSRWETREQAAKIVTHYHPWVAVIGAAVTIIGFVIAKREKDRFKSED